MLATLAQFRVRNGIASADTSYDAIATQVLQGVSSQLARAAGRVDSGRPALEKPSAAVTWYATIDETSCQTIYVPHWPIVSVTSVKEALYGGHATAMALVLNSDYQRDAGHGALRRIGYWMYGWQ
ncbi:MAG TPA: hypothetical protein VMZ50_05690, partial [Phycisphaerae bacterium]|nr:hypothetical protein [Phycisphaerae bacterium]